MPLGGNSPLHHSSKLEITMFTAATKLGSRYAIPATATGGLLVLTLSPPVVDAKMEVTKPIDVVPIKKASEYFCF
jgi:hypothetical protein